jgi:hypothetical protein
MNYAFKPLPLAQNGQKFVLMNFTRSAPHTGIFNGVTGLIFDRCLLINCDVPTDAVCLDCAPCHHDYCSNLHPEWIVRGLGVCSENCSHVVSSDIIQVGGVTMDTIYSYEDKKVD